MSEQRSRGIQYLGVLCLAILLAAAGSHLVASWLKIKVRAAEPFVIGQKNTHIAFLAGSSVADYGVDWDEIAETENLQIHVWGIAAGSPVEHEQFQQLVPEARTTFIAVSAVDLDEALISDFRAAIVPLDKAMRALWSAGADARYAREVLSQYPTTWLRSLFPTLGRSRGILGAIRVKLKGAIQSAAGEDAGPTIKFGKDGGGDNYRRQKMSDWPAEELQRKLVAMKVTFKGETSFHGLKEGAFKRMLEMAAAQGRTIVCVMPSSPAYKRAFLSSDRTRDFEDSLERLKSSVPKVEWIRVDQLPEFSSGDYFCDLTHLNEQGNKVATQAVKDRLRNHPADK